MKNYFSIFIAFISYCYCLQPNKLPNGSIKKFIPNKIDVSNDLYVITPPKASLIAKNWLQNIIADYFLTQRIKETNLKYIEQTTTLQKLLVLAMKCKQTTEIDNVEKALQLVASFSKIYFDSHGIKHLEELSH